MDLEYDILKNHFVRIVNAAVNRLNDAIFDVAYPGGGRDSYHFKMLTKVIIYAIRRTLAGESQRQAPKTSRDMCSKGYFWDNLIRLVDCTESIVSVQPGLRN